MFNPDDLTPAQRRLLLRIGAGYLVVCKHPRGHKDYFPAHVQDDNSRRGIRRDTITALANEWMIQRMGGIGNKLFYKLTGPAAEWAAKQENDHETD
jgi:hypothetical protein